MLHNIIKLTAPCWSRCIYWYLSLTKQIWGHWRTIIPNELVANIPANIPKTWQRISQISDKVVKICPFCNMYVNGERISHIEHLHLYCKSSLLVNARSRCHQKIERAIYNLYHFASLRKFGISFQQNSHITMLQKRTYRQLPWNWKNKREQL